MRRLVAPAGALLFTLGCANMGAPPGGPPRTTPPVLLSVTPDSGATNVRARGVIFEFDEVVSDQNVDRYFLLSPREGRPRVIWRRNRIEVRPRRGFRPNTAYAVTILPGLVDLRSNALQRGGTVVFSTGPTIPPYMVAGRVFDWMNERIAPDAFIEVIRRPDSLVFEGAADSTGQFTVGPLEEGTYTVRATMDNNRNRGLDRGEPWDSLSIVVRGSSPFVELLTAQRDTLPPRLLTVSPRDSVTLNVSFDRPLSPDLPLTPDAFRVVSADSTALRITRVRTAAQADSAAAAERAVADTTTRRDTTPVTRPAQPPGLEARPSRRAPPKDVVLQLDSLTPLREATTYRVTAIGMRGLLGPSRTSDRVITVARRDTTQRRPETLSRPPGAPQVPVRRP